MPDGEGDDGLRARFEILGNSPGASRTAETTDYDPRYDRAQTVEGAKARYVSDDLPDYGLDMLEADVARVLVEGDYPDRDGREEPEEVPRFEGQEVIR